MAIGLAVKVLTPDQPGGWHEGHVDALTGRVIVGGTAVAPGRVWGICHDRQRQTPHEEPGDPTELAYLVLLAVILFPDKREEIEAAAWPELAWKNPAVSAAHARAARARMVTGTASLVGGLERYGHGRFKTSTPSAPHKDIWKSGVNP